MKVQDIMTRDACCCHPGTNAAAASEIMWTRNCGVIPVVEDGRVVGMVTDRDLLIALGTSNRNAADLTVGEVMSKDPASCEPTDDVRRALETMAQRQVRRLPVIEKDGALKGILSMDDIVLAPQGDSLTNEHVIKAIKAICSNSRTENQPRAAGSKHAVA